MLGKAFTEEPRIPQSNTIDKIHDLSTRDPPRHLPEDAGSRRLSRRTTVCHHAGMHLMSPTTTKHLCHG